MYEQVDQIFHTQEQSQQQKYKIKRLKKGKRKTVCKKTFRPARDLNP